MKILLIGEFSGVHNGLRAGLRALGHDVLLAAHSDAWKGFPRDINLGWPACRVCDVAARTILPFFRLRNVQHYDVIQLINPFPFVPLVATTRAVLARTLKYATGKKFLVAAGEDSFYFREAEKHLAYSPVQDILKYDRRSNWRRRFWYRSDVVEWCQQVHDLVHAVIPTCYEYDACYSWSNKRTRTIPFPIDVSDIPSTPNTVRRGRIVFFHGLNRAGVRGTRYILEAFELLQKKYPNDLEFITRPGIPIASYKEFLTRVNVVVDQTSGYSPGMNALFSLASGRVVLGGNEPEARQAWSVGSCPVVNIRPNVASIVEGVESLLARKADFEELGEQGRRYVQQHHSAEKVAAAYVAVWNKSTPGSIPQR